MVNPNSPAYKISSKIGFIIGRGIRYLILGGLVLILGGKLSSSKSLKPVSNPPAPFP